MVVSDEDGPGCELEEELVDANVVVSQPVWPACGPRDLEAAIEEGITVTEVTFNLQRHVFVQILSLVRNCRHPEANDVQDPPRRREEIEVSDLMVDG